MVAMKKTILKKTKKTRAILNGTKTGRIVNVTKVALVSPRHSIVTPKVAKRKWIKPSPFLRMLTTVKPPLIKVVRPMKQMLRKPLKSLKLLLIQTQKRNHSVKWLKVATPQMSMPKITRTTSPKIRLRAKVNVNHVCLKFVKA